MRIRSMIETKAMEALENKSKISFDFIVHRFHFSSHWFSSKNNRRMEYKNKKFGFGGQKKYSKKNTAESSADVFNAKPNKWQRPAFHAQKGKKVRHMFTLND